MGCQVLKIHFYLEHLEQHKHSKDFSDLEIGTDWNKKERTWNNPLVVRVSTILVSVSGFRFGWCSCPNLVGFSRLGFSTTRSF